MGAIRAIEVDPDEVAALRRIVAVGLREISGSDFVAISELRRRSIQTRAVSDPHAELLDRAQYEAGEGPCLTATVDEAAVVVSADLAADERWPTFGRAAVRLGVNSVISFKLFDGTATIGALNLYSRKPDAFNSDAEAVGLLLAAHAAVVLVASRKQANLNVALATRDVIGQAKGILMERYKIDDREAFDALISVSQRTHRKLREVADHLRATREFAMPG